MPTSTLRGRRCGRRLASVTLALALTGGVVAAAPTAGAQANPFQRGPNPTNASIEATTGAFATSTTTVGRGNGFGGGTIYFPTSTAEGTFGAIAVAPGFTATQSSIAWLGPRIASQGFVVFTIDTNSRFDNPSARATQLQNALNYLVNTSSVRTRSDASRLGVMGHSMGGGGTLEAARNNTNLQAAVPLMPWDQTKSFPGIRTPTLIIGSQNDGTASPANHAIPFFNSIPARLGEGVPGAGGGRAHRGELAQHDACQVRDLVAQALHRQRHPLRAVPLPGAQRLDHLPVPGYVPGFLNA